MTSLQQDAVALFNFLLRKQENDKRIGDLSMMDLMELVKFLKERRKYEDQ